MSKNTLIILSLGMLVVAVILGALGCQPTGVVPPAAAATAGSQRAITVIGNGTASIKPDIVRANIGVEVRAPTVEEATSEANQRMTALMTALDEADIAAQDIQTSRYSIYFEEDGPYQFPAGVPSAPGAASSEPEGRYQVSNQLQVVIRDLDRVGKILDAVVKAGANSIYGVNFTVEDPSAAQSEARAKAVTDARTKAEEYARLNDVELGQVIAISEAIGDSFLAMMGAAAAPQAAPISPGDVEVGVQIQITYALQ